MTRRDLLKTAAGAAVAATVPVPAAPPQFKHVSYALGFTLSFDDPAATSKFAALERAFDQARKLGARRKYYNDRRMERLAARTFRESFQNPA